MKKKALVIICDGVEEIEAVVPINLLRRAEVEVTVVALTEQLTVSGRSNIALGADADLESVRSSDWDMIVLPGGPGHISLMKDDRVLELLRKQNESEKWIAAICAAPKILKEANVLGEEFTAHYTTIDDLPNAKLEELVIVSGNIITSRGAGTAHEFALELVRQLVGEDVQKEVSKSICFPS